MHQAPSIMYCKTYFKTEIFERPKCSAKPKFSTKSANSLPPPLIRLMDSSGMPAVHEAMISRMTEQRLMRDSSDSSDPCVMVAATCPREGQLQRLGAR